MDIFVEKIHSSLKPGKIEYIKSKDGYSAAAVLLLLIKMNDVWNILYTRRTNFVRSHQGEVSFPGGAFEQQDHNLTDTALRETKEEIGIDPHAIEILGSFEPYKTISGYYVYPFVGIIMQPVSIHINPCEVERVFYIPLDWLSIPENYYEQDYVINDFVRKVIHYKEYEGEHLWGFTARVTQQLLEIIK